tara:strand:- start:680 stop:1057 length:378 start_codon:yes stop_codon:yes gene_type:complete
MTKGTKGTAKGTAKGTKGTKGTAKGTSKMYSNREVLNNELLDYDSSAICFDGYDDAVIGAILNDETWVAVYAYGLIIKQLKDDGMDHDEAIEFAEYNVIPSIPDDGPIVLDMYITPTGEVINEYP